MTALMLHPKPSVRPRNRLAAWGLVLACAAGGLAAFTGSAVAQAPPLTVREYLAAGYRIESKTVEQKEAPGLPPYEELRRLVEVSTYVLVRDGFRVTCIMAYDSQRESLATVCG